ncbi:protein ALP1-like [Aristolochia californica]|uniref:protein ALP1-like n=1 Tax=Aristolochia californica TaxID=171875 RepID=UPI0035E3A84B
MEPSSASFLRRFITIGRNFVDKVFLMCFCVNTCYVSNNNMNVLVFMDNLSDEEKIGIMLNPLKLTKILKSRGFLSDTRIISLEEQLAYFLFIVGQQQSHSVTSKIFDRSNETISKYFNKDCIVVIDGTHIKVHIPLDQQERFWNKKGFLSQNVMVACTFDMQFTYVLAGWEGSASDSHVLKSAFTRRDKFHVLEGKYYLVDDGYANLPRFLAPYRGTHYHLQECGDNFPKNDRELFNQRHSSLRKIIQRTFRDLKARFQILKDIFENEVDDLNDKSDGEDDEGDGIDDDEDSDDLVDDDDYQRESVVQSERASYFRDKLATQMWLNY